MSRAQQGVYLEVISSESFPGEMTLSGELEDQGQGKKLLGPLGTRGEKALQMGEPPKSG